MNRYIENTAVLPGGIRLPYVESGSENGNVLVLLHGYTDSWRSFEPLLLELPPSLRVIAVTQRGHGEASRPAAGYAPEDFAGDLAAFLDVLGIERAIIAGHSMGSFVAQCFALRFPERTLGMALMGSGISYRSSPAALELEAAVTEFGDTVPAGFARDFQASTVANIIAPEFLEMVTGESLKLPAFVWKAALLDFMNADYSSRLHEIDVPTLIAWGDQDAIFVRRDQDYLARQIRHAQLAVYAGAGHAPHWEMPEKVATDLVKFAFRCTAHDVRQRQPVGVA